MMNHTQTKYKQDSSYCTVNGARKRGTFFGGAYFPKKLTLKSSIGTEYKLFQKSVCVCASLLSKKKRRLLCMGHTYTRSVRAQAVVDCFKAYNTQYPMKYPFFARILTQRGAQNQLIY
jgi:hypothetical protein